MLDSFELFWLVFCTHIQSQHAVAVDFIVKNGFEVVNYLIASKVYLKVEHS
jgi:hypothetical protein